MGSGEGKTIAAPWWWPCPPSCAGKGEIAGEELNLPGGSGFAEHWAYACGTVHIKHWTLTINVPILFTMVRGQLGAAYSYGMATKSCKPSDATPQGARVTRLFTVEAPNHRKP